MTQRGIRASMARLAGCTRRLFGSRVAVPPDGLVPAVPIDDSITPNFLICLETGTRQVALRRHLVQTLRMSPAEYRARWGLPPEYPMVAAAYGVRRKSVQNLGAPRKHGLGTTVVEIFQELFRPVAE